MEEARKYWLWAYRRARALNGSIPPGHLKHSLSLLDAARKIGRRYGNNRGHCIAWLEIAGESRANGFRQDCRQAVFKAKIQRTQPDALLFSPNA